MEYYIGIDVGSSFTKLALIDESRVLSHKVVPTGVNCQETTVRSLKELLDEFKIPDMAINPAPRVKTRGFTGCGVKYIVSTGYGRRLINVANDTISEITANATGAQWLGKSAGCVRTIIDIGGQDSKVIALDEKGVTKNFAMNDKCAAGTGRFLENMARILEINITDLGDLSLQAKIPVKINSTCTVFAESEVISLLARGKAKPEIIAGLHYSIAKRIVRLVKRIGIEDMVFFDGGPALNNGLVKAMEDELARGIYVPPTPQITTAIGAALIAKEAFLKEVHSGSY
ncbi:MAG: acyl-CoA dehydratase activase [Nitrospirota bacterium]